MVYRKTLLVHNKKKVHNKFTFFQRVTLLASQANTVDWPGSKAVIFQGDIYGQLLKPCNGSNKEALKGPEAQPPVSTAQETHTKCTHKVHTITHLFIR